MLWWTSAVYVVVDLFLRSVAVDVVVDLYLGSVAVDVVVAKNLLVLETLATKLTLDLDS